MKTKITNKKRTKSKNKQKNEDGKQKTNECFTPSNI
jgi:hypothetical protein